MTALTAMRFTLLSARPLRSTTRSRNRSRTCRESSEVDVSSPSRSSSKSKTSSSSQTSPRSSSPPSDVTRTAPAASLSSSSSSGGERAVKKALNRLQSRPGKLQPLFDALLSTQAALPRPLSERISQALSTDRASLSALVDMLVSGETTTSTSSSSSSQSSPHREARTRLAAAWAAAALVSAGDACLAQALSKDAGLVNSLATVLTKRPFDEARAGLVAQVLHRISIESPRATADALAGNERVLEACVDAVQYAPATDVLSRMVATRVFGMHDAGAVVPAHKRSVAALARYGLQKKLAARFVKGAKSDYRVCEGVADAMAEVSGRAMAMPRLLEDPDERHDGYAFGMTHLSIVPAHVFNDARESLCLASAPKPLLSVIDVALQNPANLDVSVPALKLLARTLETLQLLKESLLPEVRTSARKINTEELESELLTRASKLLRLLAPSHASGGGGMPFGRLRLAIVDALIALLAIASDKSCRILLEELRLIDAILDILRAYPHASLVHTRTNTVLARLLSGTRALGELAVKSSGLVEFFLANVKNSAMLGHHSETIVAMNTLLSQKDGELSKRFRSILGNHAEGKKKERESGLFRKASSPTPSVNVKGERDVMSSLKGCASEDYGHNLFMRTMSQCTAVEKRHGPMHDLGELFGHHSASQVLDAAQNYIKAHIAHDEK